MDASPVGDSLSMIAYKGTTAQFDEYVHREKPDLTRVDEDVRTPLHWAASGGNLPLVQLLLANDAVKSKCLNAKDESEYTPLMSAVAAGHAEVTRELLGAGAKANTRNENMCIPLHYHKGRIPIIDLLLPHTKEINARDDHGVTPLHRACGPGYIEAARALLAAGADADAADAQGCTPLHYACEEARAEVVALLLEHGARTDVKNSEGKTPLDVIPRHEAANRVRSTMAGAAAGRA